MLGTRRTKFNMSKLLTGIVTIGAISLCAGVLAGVTSPASSFASAGDSSTVVDTAPISTVPTLLSTSGSMSCNFGLVGNYAFTDALSLSVDPDPVGPGGNIALSGTESFTLPTTLVSDLENQLAATSLTIISADVDINAAGDVVQPEEIASISEIDHNPLPYTISSADLSDPIVGELSTVGFTAGTDPGNVTVSLGDFTVRSTVNLATGTIPDQGGSCTPQEIPALGTVAVDQGAPAPTTTTGPGNVTTTEPTQTPTTTPSPGNTNCDLAVIGNVSTNSDLTETVTPDSVGTGGTLTLGGSEDLTIPASVVEDLSAGLGVQSITIDNFSVAIVATGDVIQTEEEAVATNLDSYGPLPATIPIANLAEPLTFGLSRVRFKAGSSPGNATFSAGQISFSVTANLGSAYGESDLDSNLDSTCVPDTFNNVASAVVVAPLPTTVSKSPPSQSESPLGHLKSLFLWLFELLSHLRS